MTATNSQLSPGRATSHGSSALGVHSWTSHESPSGSRGVAIREEIVKLLLKKVPFDSQWRRAPWSYLGARCDSFHSPENYYAGSQVCSALAGFVARNEAASSGPCAMLWRSFRREALASDRPQACRRSPAQRRSRTLGPSTCEQRAPSRGHTSLFLKIVVLETSEVQGDCGENFR